MYVYFDWLTDSNKYKKHEFVPHDGFLMLIIQGGSYERRRMIAGLASFAMATTLVACSSGSSGKDQTLTVGVNQELNGVFSPAYYSSSYDNYAIDLVYEVY